MSESITYQSVTTDDGFTVSSNTATSEAMAENFAPDVEVQIDAPAQAQPDAEEATPVPEGHVAADVVDPILARNDDGTFKSKAKKGSLNELRQNIAKATWEREEAKREADRYKAELETLKSAPKAEPKPEPRQPVSEQPQTFPDYAAWEAQHSGKSYEEYIDARTDWKFEQRKAADLREAAERQQQDSIARVEVAGTQAHPDFKEKLSAVVAAGLQFPPVLTDAILSEDPTLGHALAYEYATHLDDLRRLLALPPAKAALVVGKTLARLEAPHSGSAPAAPALSRAHPPIQPVSGSPSADADEPSDDEPLDRHILRYNAADRKAGRR